MKSKSQTGFTLLEVMVALGISGLVLLGFGSFMKGQIDTASHLEYQLAAEQAARNAMPLLCVDPEGLKGVGGEELQSEGRETVRGVEWSWQRTLFIEKTVSEEGEEEERALRVTVMICNGDEPVHEQELYLPLSMLKGEIPCKS